MYAATLTIAAATETITGDVDAVTEWLATHHDGWDIDGILSAMVTVLNYGSTRGDIVTTTGRFQVKEITA
jgi:hypothetical protein